MKKIIGGKVYDTGKAKAVAKYAIGGAGPTRVKEVLYRKRTGEFFIHGEGGVETPYARPVGGYGWAPGERIIPLSYEAAREWAEARLRADDYENVFGEVQENDGRTCVSLSLSQTAYARARRGAAVEGISLSAYVELLIRKESKQ